MASKHRFATEEIEKFSTVDLISELKRRYQVLGRPERNCVLLGPDYVGISTQAAFLRKEWGLCTIKRDEIMRESNSLDAAMKKLSGEIETFQCRRGFALTNFPETVEEANALDAVLKLKHPKRVDYKVLMLDLPSANDAERKDSTAILQARAQGMLVHPKSGRIYNTSDPELTPHTPNVDDVTGDALVCPNWKLTDLENRLNDWWGQRRPQLVSFFKRRSCFIDASKPRDSVSIEISRILLGEEHTQKEPDTQSSQI